MIQLPFFRKKHTTFTYRIALSLFAFLVLMSSVAATASASVPNPYLSSPLYGITHFDSAQTDTMPYGPQRGTFTVDPSSKPISYGGPVNIITLASTDPDYMWGVGNNRVSYIHKADGAWKEVASYAAIADTEGNILPPVPKENFRRLGESSTVGMTVDTMDAYLKEILVRDEFYTFGNGAYSVVDDKNVLYTNFGNSLYAFALKDPASPSSGIVVKGKINDVVKDIQGEGVLSRVFGLAMTYDGHLVVTFRNGVAVIDRELTLSTKELFTFGNLVDDAVSNSVAIDEKNGIYLASNKKMRKLVWTGTEISEKESDGAWQSEYDVDKTPPPIVKFDYGTGSTPTLMGFGDDQDKLVIITDGEKRMKLVAFWRDDIPEGFEQRPGTKSRRIAGQIDVTCGLKPLPEWIQSEQSVVVSGYEAFVVNNMPTTVADELKKVNNKKVLQVSLMGPAYPGPLGVERFKWDTAAREWKSVWSRSDIASNSMIPAYSQLAKMALVNGYYKESGWEVTGLDWNTGETAHRTIFGQKNLGNGAYAIIQYLKNGSLPDSLLFNSIVGPFRVEYNKVTSDSGVPINRYFSQPLYGITHFDSAQTDSMPYGPQRGTFTVDPSSQPIAYGGPVNIITLASTDPNCMWAVGHDKVSYVDMADGAWKVVATYEALAETTGGRLPAIPNEKFRQFGESSAVGWSVPKMKDYLLEILGPNHTTRFLAGATYSVVDNDNVLYTNYGNSLYAFTLKDSERPSLGIKVKYEVKNVFEKIHSGKKVDNPVDALLFGLAMTYDGYIVVTFRDGVAVIDRELTLDTNEFCPFNDVGEKVSNSLAIDEDGGIYIASNKWMRKLVWTGTKLSDSEADGAWKCEYDNYADEMPPIVKFFDGTGSTPTLMGFGDDPDKLVVITDGKKQMNLVAFWRDDIPAGKTARIAHQIPVTCGLKPLPEWIQSEQSVVVSGYGAFVVNNMPTTIDQELKDQYQDKILQVALMGPAYDGPLGVERFEWDPKNHKWKDSIWSRNDVSSTSMVPVHSQSASMALVNGYYEGSGWEVTGLDWDTGTTVHRTIFGDKNLGNGAYAIIQYLKDGSLLFNSIVGPLRVKYSDSDSDSGGCAVAGITAGSALLLMVPLLLALRGKKR